MSSWFEADKEGLRKILESRGKEALLFELISNAWDTDTKAVHVDLAPIPGVPEAALLVRDDDPNGFADLTHAYTLFAESNRKDDATKRGRFNLGEKLVLAMCTEAKILTTRGSVYFGDKGRRAGRAKTEKGTSFEATIRITRAEFEVVCRKVMALIPPIPTFFRGERIPKRKPVRTFEVTLPTELGDEGGSLRRTRRKATVNLYEPKEGERATLYELGVPVVETEDRWHADVQQKVPLTLDRTNVLPSFLRELRAAILNNAHRMLSEEDSAKGWVTEALTSKKVEQKAVQVTIEKRFGERAVAYDPSDKESNNKAVAEGFKVVHGGSLPKAAWKNVRESSALTPAGRKFPTPKPYSDDPDADLVELIPRSEWTPAMVKVADLADRLADELMGVPLTVLMVRAQGNFRACYGKGGKLDFNLKHLAPSFFEGVKTPEGRQEVLDLLIHEFGHQYASNHLSEDYYRALTRLGSQAVELALSNPDLFEV